MLVHVEFFWITTIIFKQNATAESTFINSIAVFHCKLFYILFFLIAAHAIIIIN